MLLHLVSHIWPPDECSAFLLFVLLLCCTNVWWETYSFLFIKNVHQLVNHACVLFGSGKWRVQLVYQCLFTKNSSLLGLKTKPMKVLRSNQKSKAIKSQWAEKRKSSVELRTGDSNSNQLWVCRIIPCENCIKNPDRCSFRFVSFLIHILNIGPHWVMVMSGQGPAALRFASKT